MRAAYALLIAALFVARHVCRSLALWTTIFVVLLAIVAASLHFGLGRTVGFEAARLPLIGLALACVLDGVLGGMVRGLDAVVASRIAVQHDDRRAVRGMLAIRSR